MKSFLVTAALPLFLVFFLPACSLLEEEPTDEENALYMLNSVWFDIFEGDIDDSTTFAAQNTVEFDESTYFIESYVEVYGDHIDPDNSESFFYFTGEMTLQSVETIDDVSSTGLLAFSNAALDTEASAGEWLALDETQLDNPDVSYSVEFEYLDTTIVETYEDENGDPVTDSIHVTGIGALTLDAWYDDPDATEFFTILIDDGLAKQQHGRPLFSRTDFQKATPAYKGKMSKRVHAIANRVASKSQPVHARRIHALK